jgi:hypothetical protein
MTATFDSSPADGSLGVLVGFVGGSSYRRLAEQYMDGAVRAGQRAAREVVAA